MNTATRVIDAGRFGTCPDKPLRIRVSLEGRGTVARVTRFTMDDTGRLVPMSNTAFEVTQKGEAAAAYLHARTAFWNAVTTGTPGGLPDYTTPRAIAAGIVLTVAADAYRQDHDGYICEDCGLLESCCCPDV